MRLRHLIKSVQEMDPTKTALVYISTKQDNTSQAGDCIRTENEPVVTYGLVVPQDTNTYLFDKNALAIGLQNLKKQMVAHNEKFVAMPYTETTTHDFQNLLVNVFKETDIAVGVCHDQPVPKQFQDVTYQTQADTSDTPSDTQSQQPFEINKSPLLVTSIRDPKLFQKDHVLATVRKIMKPNAKFEPHSECSPSQKLLYTYLDLKKQGNWNQQTFDEIYLPRYLKEQASNPTALATMANLLSKDTSNMGAFCYCGNESLCHRSILGGILQGNGKQVEGLEGDYSKYAEQFAKTYEEIHHKPLDFSEYAQPKSSSTSYRIALTGHRPKAFKAVRGNVYDLSDPTYQKLYKELHDYAVEKLDEHGSITCISGMALGADTIWAMVATNLKQEYDHDRVHFEAHSPLATHAEKWTKESQNQYQYLLNHSDKVVYYGAAYSPKLMMDRNIGMINNCDELLAVYNGISESHSGTKHAIDYAISQGKAVHYTNRDYFAVSAPTATQSALQSPSNGGSSYKPTYDSNFRMRDDLEVVKPSQKAITQKPSVSDITKITHGCIMHQVNCQGVMGAGVAKALYTKYPVMKQSYLDFCAKYPTPQDRLGQFQPIKIKDGLYVCNSFSQLEYGNAARTNQVYTDEAILKQNLTQFDEWAKRKNLPAYVPARIGCGLAGGNWAAIEDYIRNNTDITIVDPLQQSYNFESNKTNNTQPSNPSTSHDDLDLDL